MSSATPALGLFIVFHLSFTVPLPSAAVVSRATSTTATAAGRLPTDTAPVAYNVSVTPCYGSTRFDGELDATVAVTRDTSEIALNARGLYVFVAYVHDAATQLPVDVTDVRYDEDAERVTLFTETELRAGRRYAVNVEYRGTVGGASTGLYESAYRDPDGYRRWLYVTFLEPTGARQIFPCYDEPAYKTPFCISLTRPENKRTRSNMPNSTTHMIDFTPQWQDVYVETPPIATHQVAFVISDFQGSAIHCVGKNTTIYSFTRDEYADQIQYVLNEAPRLLAAMESFTETLYELSKLDLFAVPDFKTDAMGNWGLTTYREKYLLLDQLSSAKHNESGLSMVQREIARQWFGNLVTCSWWDYIWLHDAFTTYFQYFATGSVYPEWEMDRVFVIEQHQQALAYDQKPRRPITATVQTSAEINEVFYDPMSSKAASFLRMLKYATNETIFQQSLVRYLKNNKYESVGPEALYSAFESTIHEYDFDFGQGVTVTGFMKQWTEQAGYPVIDVTKIDDKFYITQERFLIDTADNATAADPPSDTWPVGVTYVTESSKDFGGRVKPVAWCGSDAYHACVVPAPRDDVGWYIFNVRSTGLYRVNYDADNWRSLTRQLNDDPAGIDALNRAQLVDDAFNLARADKLQYAVPLRLWQYLTAEDDVTPWYSAIGGYAYLLERMRRNGTEHARLNDCVSQLAGIIYKKIEDKVAVHEINDHSTLTSWNAFSVWACELANEICEESAFDYYKKWQNGQKIPSDIRDAAFCVGIRVTNEEQTWQQMFELYTTTKSPSVKQSAQKALACTKDDMLLSRYLNYIFEPEGPIREQDFKDVFVAVSSTPKGLDVLIDFLAQNLNRITKQIPDGNEIAIFIYSLCASKAALDNEIIRLQYMKDDPTTPNHLKIVFNEKYHQVDNNLYWYTKYHDIVNENGDCSTKDITTVHPHESTTFSSTSSTMALNISTIQPQTSPHTTELSTSTTTTTKQTQTTTQTYTTTSYTTNITQTETMPYSSTEASTSMEPETKPYTISEPSTSQNTSIAQSTTTVYTSTIQSTSHSLTTESKTTSSTATTASPSYNLTSEQPSTTYYTTKEPSTSYSTITEIPGITNCTSTEPPPTYNSTTQIPSTTYNVSTEPYPPHSSTPEQPSTTQYMSTEPSPLHSSTTPISSTTQNISTEPYPPFSSTTEQPSTTQYMSTEPPPPFSSTTQIPSTTYNVSIEPYPPHSSTTEQPSTTQYVSTEPSTPYGSTTQISSTTQNISTEPYPPFSSTPEQPSTTQYMSTETDPPYSSTTEQPSTTQYMSTEPSSPYSSTTQMSSTTQNISTEPYPPHSSTTEKPSTTQYVSTEPSPPFSSTTQISSTTHNISTETYPPHSSTTEQPSTTQYVSTEPSPPYGSTTQISSTTQNISTEPYPPFSSTPEQPSTTQYMSTETDPPDSSTTEQTSTTQYMSTEPSPPYSSTTQISSTTHNISTETYPPYSSTTEQPSKTQYMSTETDPPYSSTTEQHSTTQYMSTEPSPPYGSTTQISSTTQNISTEPYPPYSSTPEQPSTTHYFNTSTELSTPYSSTTQHPGTIYITSTESSLPYGLTSTTFVWFYVMLIFFCVICSLFIIFMYNYMWYSNRSRKSSHNTVF